MERSRANLVALPLRRNEGRNVRRGNCRRFSDAPDSDTNIELLKRLKAKLDAFISPPSSTLATYPEKDQSVVARYARAIAYYRIPQLDRALPTIDGLIRDFPKDPYFRELKGQMLFENGRIADAIPP